MPDPLTTDRPDIESMQRSAAYQCGFDKEERSHYSHSAVLDLCKYALHCEATIRDRERERDDKEYARKEWAETAHRVIMERDELQRAADEDQEQNDKLMEYARKVAGRRDVHSVYEVLDQVTELQRKLEEALRKLAVDEKFAAPTWEGGTK